MIAIAPSPDRIAGLLDLGRGKRYLDVGCGTAAFAHLLAVRSGLDTPPVTVDLAAGPGPIDVAGWPEALPFRDGSFDAITSLYLVRRLDDEVVNGFAREVARLLAPGGRALIVELAPVRNRRLNALHGWVASPGCPRVDLRGWGRLAALLTECGFASVELVDPGPLPLPPIPRVAALVTQRPERPLTADDALDEAAAVVEAGKAGLE
jgi:SAM-dependent methyltransferase